MPTWFGRIIGITELTVNATATACAPCSVKPLDIMVVLDRTGSMCQSAPGVNDPNCTDLNNARAGIRTFASMLDPTTDKLGLALTPPVVNASMISNCGNPVGSGYKPWTGTPNPNVPAGDPNRNTNGQYYGYDAWWPYYTPDPRGSTPAHYVVASLEGADGYTPDDYVVRDAEWQLGSERRAVRIPAAARLHVRCGQHELLAVDRGGAVRAQSERTRQRPGRDHLHVGRRREHVADEPAGRALVEQPEPTATARAGAAFSRRPTSRPGGTVIYTIGYDLDAGSATPERCMQPLSNGHGGGSTPEQCGTWGCTAYDAIRAMATSPQNFYNKPNPGELDTIFRAIALDLNGSRGRLIDNTTPNLP